MLGAAFGWLGRRFASLAKHVGDIVDGPHLSPGCVPLISDDKGTNVTLATPKPTAPLDPGDINPGLAPDINATPRRQ